MKNVSVEVLKSCKLFASIAESDLIALLGCLKPRVAFYEKKEYIAIAGEEFSGFGVVLEGKVAIIKEDAAGRRMKIGFVYPSQLFGEMAAFTGMGGWPTTVQAEEDTEVIWIPTERMLSTCANVCVFHRQLIFNMLHIMAETALLLNRKVEYFAMKSMRSKLSAFMLEHWAMQGKKDTFNLPFNRNSLAEFLNVSRPSMSRELARMKEEGVIDFYLSTIQIKDIEKLKAGVE